MKEKIEEILNYCNEIQRNCKRLTTGNVVHLAPNISNGVELIKMKLKELEPVDMFHKVGEMVNPMSFENGDFVDNNSREVAVCVRCKNEFQRLKLYHNICMDCEMELTDNMKSN